METIKNIKKVSLIFFVITGFLHLGSSVFIANNAALKTAEIINKTMDIPFILTGLLYGFSSLRINLSDPEKNHKTLDIVLISVIIVILLAVIGINIFVVDRPI